MTKVATMHSISLDEITLGVIPITLGRGVRLFDGIEPPGVDLELVRAVDAPGVTHLTYRVLR